MSLFENIVNPQSAPANSGSIGVRVLAVEDDPVGKHAIQRVLERAGYTVTVATDFRGAVDALAASEFDLVVSDFRLPGGNGLDLLDFANGCRPNTPFILLSGVIDSGIRQRAREMGARAVLEKPVPLGDLLHEMKWALVR